MTAVASFFMKLIRADEHLEALNDAVEAFLAIHPYEVVTEKDIPARTYRAKLIHRHPPPGRLLMIIGDVLYNLRSALDHIAWCLAGQRADMRTEFPIFIESKQFSAIDKKGLPMRGSGLSKMHDMRGNVRKRVNEKGRCNLRFAKRTSGAINARTEGDTACGEEEHRVGRGVKPDLGDAGKLRAAEHAAVPAADVGRRGGRRARAGAVRTAPRCRCRSGLLQRLRPATAAELEQRQRSPCGARGCAG